MPLDNTQPQSGSKVLSQVYDSGNDSLFVHGWTDIPGQSVDTAYYTGIIVGSNPSGSLTNVETETFKKDGTTVFVRTYKYNASDLVISLIVT